MQAPLKSILTLGLAAVVAAAYGDAALAKAKKHRTSHTTTKSSGNPGVKRDYDGTPIIMQGYNPRRTAPADAVPQQRADRPVKTPRGSSTYISPSVPSPNALNSPPARALTQPMVQPYNPPPITTYGDRVTGAIHSYPLDKGIGNNPVDQQMFIRQRANQ
jgi:hypothetical protein